MKRNFTKFAFNPSVKDAQERYGSRRAYSSMEQSGDRFELTVRETSFIESLDSFFMATVGENGWPYVQFRGGPPGFLKVLDRTTLGMADFRGNRQYISVGNINASGRTSLFLIDYPTRSRLKIWAEAEVVELEGNEEMLARVRPSDYEAVVERMIIYRVQAFDWNCQQHITPRFTLEEIEMGMAT